MPPGGLEHMLGRFEQRGWRPTRDGRRVGLSIALLGGACEMAASLLLTERAEEDGTATVLITSGSTASLNGMRLLRADLGGDAATWKGLDGEDNLIGPFDADAGSLLPRQLRLVPRPWRRSGRGSTTGSWARPGPSCKSCASARQSWWSIRRTRARAYSSSTSAGARCRAAGGW